MEPYPAPPRRTVELSDRHGAGALRLAHDIDAVQLPLFVAGEQESDLAAALR